MYRKPNTHPRAYLIFHLQGCTLTLDYLKFGRGARAKNLSTGSWINISAERAQHITIP